MRSRFRWRWRWRCWRWCDWQSDKLQDFRRRALCCLYQSDGSLRPQLNVNALGCQVSPGNRVARRVQLDSQLRSNQGGKRNGLVQERQALGGSQRGRGGVDVVIGRRNAIGSTERPLYLPPHLHVAHVMRRPGMLCPPVLRSGWRGDAALPESRGGSFAHYLPAALELLYSPRHCLYLPLTGPVWSNPYPARVDMGFVAYGLLQFRTGAGGQGCRLPGGAACPRRIRRRIGENVNYQALRLNAKLSIIKQRSRPGCVHSPSPGEKGIEIS